MARAKKVLGKRTGSTNVNMSGKVKAAGKVKAVGRVTHFYDRIGVAAILLEKKLQQGDTIRIGRNDQFVEQTVSSLQLEHETIKAAKKGQEIGLKVLRPVRENDVVVKV